MPLRSPRHPLTTLLRCVPDLVGCTHPLLTPPRYAARVRALGTLRRRIGRSQHVDLALKAPRQRKLYAHLPPAFLPSTQSSNAPEGASCPPTPPRRRTGRPGRKTALLEWA